MSGLYTLNLKCKLITPMFMAGADGRTPELRPSEFKGMMRWWWRAIKAESNHQNLLKAENEIFGGTGSGEGKSKVSIVVYPNELNYDDNIRTLIQNYDGLKYLLYSTFTLKSKGEPIIRKYFTPNQVFNLNLVSSDKKAYDNACASLWLSIYLGGFGTRARRGGGNLMIEKVNGECELDFVCNAKNKSELKNYLQKNLDKLFAISSKKDNRCDYTTLKEAKIFVFNPTNNWIDALNSIGEEFKTFRTENKNKIFKTAAFGMPVMHSKFSERLVPYGFKGKNKLERLSDRWASPLIFKVIESGNYYFPVIVKLSPGGFNTIGKEKRNGKDWKLDNNKTSQYSDELINKFLETLKTSAEELVL